MDVNGSGFRLLLEPAEYGRLPAKLTFCAGQLRLASDQSLRLPERDTTTARAASSAASRRTFDRFGQLARIAPDGVRVVAATPGGDEVLLDGDGEPVAPPMGLAFEDLAVGGDARLALVASNGDGEHVLVVFHLRRRWQACVVLPERMHRVWVDRQGAVWCASHQRVVRATGAPLPHPYSTPPGHFGPLREEVRPLAVDFSVALPTGLEVQGLTGDDELLYVLAAGPGDKQVILTRPLSVGSGPAFSVAELSPELPFFTDIAALGDARVALNAPVSSADAAAHRHDAAVVRVSATEGATLVRERFPMRGVTSPYFVGASDGVVRYLAEEGPFELVALPLPRYATSGELIVNDGEGAPRSLDSGIVGCVWHRAYVEAKIPKGCAIRLFVRAGDTPEAASARPWEEQPALVWSPLASELGWHEGMVAQERDVSGLFETLLQKRTGNVRRIAGRYLQLKLELEGDGRRTPELACVRVYFQRFSYQERYLPGHFHQQEEDDGSGGLANGADVRERYFALFERTLTPLEGRIAEAELLLDPAVAPRAQLPILARLLGTELDPAWPEARQRRWVASMGRLQRLHGTLAGVRLGLDIASDGGVRRGEVIVLENWRLRRTMATLLGIHRDDADHPLTLGTMRSGNSIVGDSLILSETAARAYLALLDPALLSASDQQAANAFFDRYAHTVSILLHGRAKALNATIAAILPRLMPAHVRWQILASDEPFVLGLSPLLEVDTFLERAPAPRDVVLDATALGREGILNNPEAFVPHAVADPTSLP